MQWHNVLFLHWRLPTVVVRPLIPSGLELDTFDGSAWLGIVVSDVKGLRRRYFPPFTALSFGEMNVRTYVWSPGRSGVWFFSVDVGNRLAARAARLWYGLPYNNARVTVQAEQGSFYCHGVRVDQHGPGAELEVSYKPVGPVYRSAPETLDRWLTDRYCLYTVDRAGALACIEIHHAPWPLQHAEAELRRNTVTQPLEINLADSAPVPHFAGRLEVIAWSAERVDE